MLFKPCLPLLLIGPLFAQTGPQPPSAPPLEKWQPHMRELPAEDYLAWPCQQLSNARPETEQQRRDLATRRQACLQQYRVFTSGDGVR